MRPPETVYRGERLTDDHGRIIGRKVTVNGRELTPERSQKVWLRSEEFEWGYGGSGPAQLALALLLDATDSPEIARRAHQWFKWATVSSWGRTWSITAAQIFAWLEQWRREDPEAGEAEQGDAPHVAEGGGT